METTLVPTAASTALAILEHDPQSLRELIEVNLGGGERLSYRDLERIKMPAGGSLAFTVSTPSGEEHVKELVGVLVHRQHRRSYWAQSLDERGTRGAPDCRSDDAVSGIGDPGGDCGLCPLSAFSDTGAAPPCRLTSDVYFVAQGELLPTVLAVSPASVRVVDQYLRALTKRALAMSDVVTKFSLERTTSNGGITFAKLVCTLVEPLAPAQRPRMREVASYFRGLVQGTPF